jgi:hypothetical protein
MADTSSARRSDGLSLSSMDKMELLNIIALMFSSLPPSQSDRPSSIGSPAIGHSRGSIGHIEVAESRADHMQERGDRRPLEHHGTACVP